MRKNYYVVTDVEGGWDNVRGIYLAENEQIVLQSIANEQGITVKDIEDKYVVHLQYRIREL